MKVEYLIIIGSRNPFCKDKKSFDNFLQANADIVINGRSFKHKHLEIEYELQGGETEADKNRFFHIKLDCKDDARIEEFQELLKATRTLLHMASDKKPQLLWDDLSLHYSKLAYPLIHEIENLMRKLITKFMLTNVGLAWTKEALPDSLKTSSKAKSIENNNNYLYEIDFKDLSAVLFDEYKTLGIKELNEKIKSLEIDGDNISFIELKGFLPKSNWERYFEEHVDCVDSYLRVRWEKLYKLRCQIAHNNSFTNDDYDEACRLVGEVKPKIQDAIGILDKVEVPEDEREKIAEIVAIKTHALYGEYLQKWKQIEDFFTLQERMLERFRPLAPGQTKRPAPSSPTLSAMEIIEKKKWLMVEGEFDKLTEAHRVRNIIVHDPGHSFTADELLYRIENLDKILARQAEEYLAGEDPEVRYADNPEALNRYYEAFEREDD